MKLYHNPLQYILAVLLAIFLSCSNDAPEKGNSIVDVAKENGFNVLVAAIEQEGLKNELNAVGPFTLIAPTDEAFESNYGITLGNIKDWNVLKKIVLSHVIVGTIKKEEFSTGFYESLNGSFIEVDLNFNRIGCGSLESPSNMIAANGIVHTKSCVEFLTYSLVITLGNSSGFSDFYDLLQRFPNVIALLSENRLFTVFPPANSAFDTFFQQNGYNDVTDIPTDLAEKILRYHILPDAQLKSTDFINNQAFSTALASDKKVSITIANDVFKVNGSVIIGKNIQAERSFIHVIDQVLVP